MEALTKSKPATQAFRVQKKKYMLEMLRKYVAHAECVWKNSSMSGRTRKLDAIMRVKDHVAELNGFKTIHQISGTINSMNKNLEEILPFPSNPSYQSSFNNYLALINMARGELGIPLLHFDQ
jgi:hypothetical protein